MKFIILGAFLICSLSVSAQSFVGTQEAITILTDMEAQDMQDLTPENNKYELELYKEKKFNVKTYQMLRETLEEGSSTVEAALKETILQLSAKENRTVTELEYDNNTIADSDIARLRTHMFSLLTE